MTLTATIVQARILSLLHKPGNRLLLTQNCTGSKNDNTPIIGYECTGATNQQWELVENLTTGPWAIWSLYNVATGST